MLDEATYREVLNLVQRLSRDEQFRLLEDLASALRKESQSQQSAFKPEGLGIEVREGVDEYIQKERGSVGE